MTAQPFRAAVVQAAPVVFDVASTLEKLDRLTSEAAEQSAQLLVFPEAFISAYPKGMDFGVRMGQRSAEGRDDFRRYYESAISVPGPETELIGKTARSAGVVLVVGVIERDGGTLYCTALFFNTDGRMLGRHRKLMPTALERIVWGFGDGSTLTVADTSLGRLGAVICWENYMPMLRMAMYDQGVQLYCAPTADDRDTWLPTMRHVALEGRCFVFSACQYLTRKDCQDEYHSPSGNDPDAVLMRGGSCIIGPLGQVLAEPLYDGECIRYAEIDPADIPRGKYDFDVTGHYARPDVFRLHVNTRTANPVVSSAGETRDPFE